MVRGILIRIFSLIFCVVLFYTEGFPSPKKNVDTLPSLRNIYIEEFTAIHCSYCPQAHAVARKLKQVLGHSLDVVAVHTGNLAVPSGEEIDFRTEAGDLWYKQQGAIGMPGGAMNRQAYKSSLQGGYPLDRFDWIPFAKMLYRDTALVNLYAEARLDVDSRLLQVDVEVYYPTDCLMETNRLTVALLENNIRTTQMGTADGKNYLHKHALRSVLTDIWGDTLYVESRKVIRRNYEYQIPEDFSGTSPDLLNLDVLVLVSRGKDSVLNSLTVPVEVNSEEKRDGVQLYSVYEDKDFGGYFLPVWIENIGTDTVNTLAYTYVVNNRRDTFELTGLNLLPFTSQRINFPCHVYEFKNVNTYSLQVCGVGSHDYLSNILTGRFYRPLSLSDSVCSLEISLDSLPHENSWELYCGQGRLIDSSSLGTLGSREVFSKNLCLVSDSVYSLLLNDEWSDGIIGGSVRLLDSQGEIVYETEVAGSGISFSFMYASPGVSSEQPKSSLDLVLYPNPAKDQLSVRSTSVALQGIAYTIYSITGHKMVEGLLSSEGTINLRDCPDGFYVLVVEIGGQMGAFKFIVSRD